MYENWEMTVAFGERSSDGDDGDSAITVVSIE